MDDGSRDRLWVGRLDVSARHGRDGDEQGLPDSGLTRSGRDGPGPRATRRVGNFSSALKFFDKRTRPVAHIPPVNLPWGIPMRLIRTKKLLLTTGGCAALAFALLVPGCGGSDGGGGEGGSVGTGGETATGGHSGTGTGGSATGTGGSLTGTGGSGPTGGGGNRTTGGGGNRTTGGGGDRGGPTGGGGNRTTGGGGDRGGPTGGGGNRT